MSELDWSRWKVELIERGWAREERRTLEVGNLRVVLFERAPTSLDGAGPTYWAWQVNIRRARREGYGEVWTTYATGREETPEAAREAASREAGGLAQAATGLASLGEDVRDNVAVAERGAAIIPLDPVSAGRLDLAENLRYLARRVEAGEVPCLLVAGVVLHEPDGERDVVRALDWQSHPDAYALLGVAGAACARLARRIDAQVYGEDEP